MAKITYPDERSCYMDDWLHTSLSKLKERLKKDDDYVLIIDGQERSGKSVLAQQIARKIDPTFNHKRMCVTNQSFLKSIDEAERFQAIVFDEAFRGLSSRASMSGVNKLLVSKMMEMGQKNLFIIIVLPSIFYLDSYVVKHRANRLIHVHRKGDRRGFWWSLGKNDLKTLYYFGKERQIYFGKNIPIAKKRGRFYDQYVIDETAYRNIKLAALNDHESDGKVNRYKERNILIKALYTDFEFLTKKKMSYQLLADFCKKHKINCQSTSAINQIVEKNYM